MSIYGVFLIFFGLSTIAGVPLLSSYQVTQIKGSTYADWVSGLGASLGPALGIFIVISIIAYFVMKPLSEAIKLAETQELTNEQKMQAKIVIKRLNILTVTSLIAGYPIGNGTTIMIKTLSR